MNGCFSRDTVTYESLRCVKKGISLDIEKPEWLGQMEGILETLNEGGLISDDCDRVLFVGSVRCV